MSVPATSSPSPIPATAAAAAAAGAKPIPGAAARPIARTAASVVASGSPGARAMSPSGSSFRRVGAGGRSVTNPGGASIANALAMSIDANGHSANDDANWRTRGSEAGSVPKGMLAGSQGRGPERTVGGFEKREVRGGGGASALSGSKQQKDGAAASGDVKSAALSHVPCRFFKAGACTAGSSCPFSHDLAGKREVCQWFLKGDCKFGHKCALAHVRPGEPMSMDRRNKKDQQREARDRATGGDARSHGDDLGTSPATSFGARASPIPTPIAPVPIKSAISASLQSGSIHSPSRFASSPLREPYGPPAAVVAGSPSAGFNRPLSGAPGFAVSPSRPSPLSSSFNARAGGMSLKGSSLVNAHSPLRPPANSAAFSSSFSHASASVDKSSGQLSASFAGGARSIWSRSDTPDEPLHVGSRRAGVPSLSSRLVDDVFDEHDDHGEDLLPSSLSDLLTPKERARRMSRNDSHESYVGSPGRQQFINPHQYVGAERLAQSASAALPAGGFLQALWSQDGGDARTAPDDGEGGEGTADAAPSTEDEASQQAGAELGFGSATQQPAQQSGAMRQSLLSQQRTTPGSPGVQIHPVAPAVDAPFLMRGTDPSSPSNRVLQEHAPGQSLPGGLAAALSRMHMQPRAPSGLAAGARGSDSSAVPTPPGFSAAQTPARRDDHDEEALFHMDG